VNLSSKDLIMSLSLDIPPAEEPVSLAEARAHLKLDSSDDDALVDRLVAAARVRAEWHTGRAFITQGWTLHLDCLPRVIEIPLPPLIAVTSLTIFAQDDSATMIDTAAFRVEAAASRLVLRPEALRPAALRQPGAAALAFTAGYGDAAAVPAPIREAILELVADLYEHRGEQPRELPLAALALLAPYRVLKI
jgi:uncharacterized phiE125 gp8 family phage protein